MCLIIEMWMGYGKVIETGIVSWSTDDVCVLDCVDCGGHRNECRGQLTIELTVMRRT